jgi:hypothetical protein
MDTPTLIGIGVATALGVFISQKLQAKKNKVLAPAIEATLRAQGALTLAGIGDAIGMKGMMARGKVAMALNDMVTQGKVRVIQAPEATPQLQKVNFIKYELVG